MAKTVYTPSTPDDANHSRTVISETYTVTVPGGPAVTLKAGDSITIRVVAPVKRTAGQAAFEAHHAHATRPTRPGSFTFGPNGFMSWASLTVDARESWEAAARAVRRHHEDEESF